MARQQTMKEGNSNQHRFLPKLHDEVPGDSDNPSGIDAVHACLLEPKFRQTECFARELGPLLVETGKSCASGQGIRLTTPTRLGTGESSGQGPWRGPQVGTQYSLPQAACEENWFERSERSRWTHSPIFSPTQAQLPNLSVLHSQRQHKDDWIVAAPLLAMLLSLAVSILPVL